jgi:hypothetical protein
MGGLNGGMICAALALPLADRYDPNQPSAYQGDRTGIREKPAKWSGSTLSGVVVGEGAVERGD